MTFEKLRKLKPWAKNPNTSWMNYDVSNPNLPPEIARPRSLDPRFKGIKIDVPVKWVQNTRDNMALLDKYVHGELKWPDTGKTCGNCVNFYPDNHLEKRGAGRCKAKGFCRVHSDWPAEDTKDWTDPMTGTWFKEWPACPLYVSKNRLSKR